MERRTWGWLGPVSGILFAVVLGAAFALSGDTVDPDDSAQKVARLLSRRQDDLELSIPLFGLALFFFVVFLGYLRDHFRRVRDEGTWVVSVFWAGGLLYAAGLLIIVFVWLGESAIADYRNDPQAAKTLAALDWNSLVVLTPGLLAMTGAAAVLILRFAALPKWLGWLAVVSFVASIAPWIPLFPLWVLLAAIVLLIQLRNAPAPPHSRVADTSS